MTRIFSKLCGGALAIAFLATASVPLQAAPLMVPDLSIGATPNENVIDVQYHRGRDYYPRHRPGYHPGYRPGYRPGYHPGYRPGYRPGYHPGYRPGYRPGYWNGYHGYNYARPGYRYYNGWWYPLAAFGVGAAVGSAIAQPSYNYGNAHVQWCANRYRSYRVSDNTFQPNNGPRRQCVSPY